MTLRFVAMAAAALLTFGLGNADCFAQDPPITRETVFTPTAGEGFVVGDTVSLHGESYFRSSAADPNSYHVQVQYYYIPPGGNIQVLYDHDHENIAPGGNCITNETKTKQVQTAGQWTFGVRLRYAVQGTSDWTDWEDEHVHINVTEPGPGT